MPEASTCAGFALQFAGVGDYGSIHRIVQDDFTLEAWFKTSATLTGNNFWDGAGLIHADTAGNHDDFGSSILNDKVAFGMGNITTEAGLTELHDAVDDRRHHRTMGSPRGDTQQD